MNTIDFSREFRADDGELFRGFVDPMLGRECSQVDRLYGGAFSIHFGDLQPSARRNNVFKGEWIVTAWGCDAALQVGETLVDDRVSARETLLHRLVHLEGLTLQSFTLDATDLSAKLVLGHEVVLTLIPDLTFAGDAWTVELPGRRSVAFTADRRWEMETSGVRKTPSL
jgi:hypothetical protein